MVFVIFTSCGNIDSKIDKLDSLCDEYIVCTQNGNYTKANSLQKEMDKYWDLMNELNQENKLTENQKNRLDEIETRLFRIKDY